MSRSKVLRKYVGRPYLGIATWVWNHLPAPLASTALGRAYGVHLHGLVQLQASRQQSTGTFFFRNRPELELLTRLLGRKSQGATLDMAIVGCSKGAEVYSMAYAIRCARPDLKINLIALDISKDVLEFAEAGVYSFKSEDDSEDSQDRALATRTAKDQPSSIFERASSEEMEALFDRNGDLVTVKPRFREGITWHLGDAGDSHLIGALGLQDIVVANRFLCHMYPDQAEACLRNFARLVKPGGHLFVSGADLSVRTKVARTLGLKPVTDLISEIHNGDPSVRNDWPLRYWGLEPFDRGRTDWNVWYASVFQCAERSKAS
jgi:chemotaxis methyl-accepting protein methylase